MRLRATRVKEFHLCNVKTVKDKEGVTSTGYGEPIAFKAEEWPGGGAVQQQMYGDKLPNIRNMRMDGRYAEHTDTNGKTYFSIGDLHVSAGDGICIERPDRVDYKIRAIYPYTFLTLELEHV